MVLCIVANSRKPSLHSKSTFDREPKPNSLNILLNDGCFPSCLYMMTTRLTPLRGSYLLLLMKCQHMIGNPYRPATRSIIPMKQKAFPTTHLDNRIFQSLCISSLHYTANSREIPLSTGFLGKHSSFWLS